MTDSLGKAHESVNYAGPGVRDVHEDAVALLPLLNARTDFFDDARELCRLLSSGNLADENGAARWFTMAEADRQARARKRVRLLAGAENRSSCRLTLSA